MRDRPGRTARPRGGGPDVIRDRARVREPGLVREGDRDRHGRGAVRLRRSGSRAWPRIRRTEPPTSSSMPPARWMTKIEAYVAFTHARSTRAASWVTSWEALPVSGNHIGSGSSCSPRRDRERARSAERQHRARGGIGDLERDRERRDVVVPLIGEVHRLRHRSACRSGPAAPRWRTVRRRSGVEVGGRVRRRGEEDNQQDQDHRADQLQEGCSSDRAQAPGGSSAYEACEPGG